MQDSYEEFKRDVFQLTKIDLNAYKERQMKRRIDTLIGKNNITLYKEYVDLLKRNKDKYEEFVSRALDYFPEFKKYGMQMVAFSKQEPKLFQLLFMTENKSAKSFQDVFPILGKTAKACIDIIERDYKLEPDMAMLLFEHAWIHSFGICVMCAMGTCRFTDDEISEMLSDNFMGMMMLTKSDFSNHPTITPHRKIEE